MSSLKKFNEYHYPMSSENKIKDEPTADFYEEEEAGDDYGIEGLKKIASALGEEVVGNEINHDGHKINFFSETEMFHIDRKKFKTPKEVIDYLNNHVHGGKEEHQLESKRYRRAR